MYSYLAFGLTISSALPIPEFLPHTPHLSPQEADITVGYGTLESLPLNGLTDNELLAVRPMGDSIQYTMMGLGSVLVKNEREIIIDPEPGAEEQGFRFLITGHALGYILHQRGFLTLHASAVASSEGVVAFVGSGGMGKSTTIAALHKRGFPIVTDDLLVVQLRHTNDGADVLPGFPSIKLWPQAAEASLGEDIGTLARVHPDEEKRICRVADHFDSDKLPLKCIYVLDYLAEGEQGSSISLLSPLQACMELVKHSFVFLTMGRQGATGAHLTQCATLAKQVPVRLIRRKRSLEELPLLAAQIDGDIVYSV